MKKWCVAAVWAVAFSCVLVPAAVAKQRPADRLNAYTVVTTGKQLAAFEEKGLDITGSRVTARGVKAQMILTRSQVQDVRAEGATATLTRVKGGKTVKQFAAAQAAGGFTVWRSYDEPGGYRDQLHALARKYPQVTKLVRIGTTGQGREILALKVTQGARDKPDGSRPAVLFSATQHAREWIATEIDRRLMYHYINGWKNNDQQIKDLLKGTELWFVPVMNPDGYQYTFDVERLWRKNLRDNDGDGKTTINDGVDPNRNYPEHFKYDEEGSSKIFSSQTYRGPGPASERETQAIQFLSERVGFQFNVNYHSNGRWLLYPEGWQVGSPTADDPIYFALSGNLDRPAIDGFHPGLSSDVPLRHQRRGQRLHAQAGRRAGLDPGAEPGVPDVRVRVPGRRGAGPGGVRAQPAVRRVGRELRGGPGRPEVVARDRDEAVLHPQCRPVQAGDTGGELRVRVLLRGSAAGAGARQASARRGQRQVPHQRQPRRAYRSHVGVGGRRALQAGLGVLPRHARRGHRDGSR
jgi:hypothetical protein